MMKLKKHFTYISKNQVWRILISDSDKLIIETRDTTNREVFFNCYQIESSKRIFESFQLEEKYWIGIEAIHKDVIFFHKFAKPDMPLHKQITALGINNKKILWTNEDYSFLFVRDDKVYCFREGFEGRSFISVDYLTGEMITDLGDNYEEANELRRLSDSEKNYNNYLFPIKYVSGETEQNISGIINKQISNLEIVGDVEYNIYKDLLLFNYHSKVLSSIVNKFYAVDLSNNKVLFSEILNSNLNAFVPDSFFIYKEYLIMLKERNSVLIYKLV